MPAKIPEQTMATQEELHEASSAAVANQQKQRDNVDVGQKGDNPATRTFRAVEGRTWLCALGSGLIRDANPGTNIELVVSGWQQ